MAAWPVRPVLRVVGLAAATPEILAVFGHAIKPIQNALLDGTIVHMRRGQLLETPVDDHLSLKLFFLPTADAGSYAWEIMRMVGDVRAISSLS